MAIQNILVVDDSKTELHFLSDLLGKRGYTVRTAENGEEAMRRLGEEKPDLILMDVVMPGRTASSSRAASRATRASPTCPSSCAPARTRRPTRCGACARALATTSSSP